MTDEKKPLSKLAKSVELAAGLLYADGSTFYLRYMLLLIAPMIFLFFEEFAKANYIFLNFTSRVLELCFLWFFMLASARRCQLHGEQPPHLTQSIVSFVAFGIFSWGLLLFPLIALVQSSSHNMLVLVAFVICTMLYLRLFFFFAPALYLIDVKEQLSLQSQLQLCFAYTKDNLLTPVKILITSYVFYYLIQSIIGIFDPSDSQLIIGFVLRLFSGIPFAIGSLLAVAYIIENRNDAENSPSFPFCDQSIIALKKAGKNVVKNNLQGKRVLKYFFVALLITFANQVRYFNAEPTFITEVEHIKVADSSIVLSLNVSGKNDKPFNVEEIAYRLANEDGEALSGLAEVVDTISENKTKKFTLRFKTLSERKAEHIVSLKDVYLWYALKKIQLLDMENASIE